MAGIVLQVEDRAQTGTGGARATRKAGKLPGVLYGGALAAQPVALERNEVAKALRAGKFVSHLVEIVQGGKRQQAIPRAIQYDPVSDEPIHVDLYRVDEGTVITVQVPVRFVNHEGSPGLKRGGVLNIVQHTIEVSTPATRIPEEFTIDLSGLDIGAVVHLSAIALPANVTPRARDRDMTIATIAGRLADEPEAAAPAAGAAEGEGDKAGDKAAAPAAKK
ncbi:MAG: 50S ribosomal protein L25/general stress protein Ctc [Hyphomonadaceae bacterium]